MQVSEVTTLSTPPANASGRAESGQKEDRKSRVTLKDVAKAAGVHFTTVSLALRRHDSIPATTRDFIKATADRLGYTPNPVFQALTHFHLHGRVRAAPPEIAYVVNQSLHSGAVRYRHQEAILEGARHQARVLGYELRFLSVDAGLNDSASIARVLEAQRINGLILASFEPGEAEIDLPWGDFAVVKINSLHMAPEAPVVANDQRQDVRLAFQEMLARGYKRIGLAVGRGDEEATEYRYTTGYLIEQATVREADRIPALLFPRKSTPKDVSRLLKAWIQRHQVDSVLCNWSIIAELIRDSGLRVPEDVACACLCLLEKDNQVAGVCPNLHMVGEKAVSLLTTRLKTGEIGVPAFASRTYVRSFWQCGTTAPSRR